MKLFYKISFALIFFFQNINAQNTVIYSARLNSNNFDKSLSKKNLSKEQQMINQIVKNARNLNCVLNFDNYNSFFYKEENMKNDSKPKQNITEIAVGKGVFYTHVNNLILHQKESFGEMFLISYPQFEWVLTQEEKEIGDYICYKATSIKTIDTNRGKINKRIVAWYTPDIPASFGPKEFSGLPGLILELNEGKLLFKAVKIELNSKNKIIKPTKGKKVSLKEYYELIKKASSNFFEKYKNK